MAMTKPAKIIKPLVRSEQEQHSHITALLPRAVTHEGVVLERHIREGKFQRSLSLITSISGLLAGLEVAYEHYRGSYGQRVMYSPLIVSGALFISGLWGTFSRWAARTVLRWASVLCMVDGIVGFYYHIRGVARKPGGWRISVFNVIMGPPIFAPLLLSTVSFLGVIASFLRQEDAPVNISGLARPGFWSLWLPRKLTYEGLVFEQDVREGRFQRILAIVTLFSAFFSGVEALYSHYKNNFSYRIQWSPVLIAPLLMLSSLGAIWSRTIARTLLPITSLLALINGVMGFFYHARGVLRRPGGLHKPFYNIMYGPPILAPLLFSAAGFTGLLASLLRRARK
jgi:hypothetical protein